MYCLNHEGCTQVLQVPSVIFEFTDTPKLIIIYSHLKVTHEDLCGIWLVYMYFPIEECITTYYRCGESSLRDAKTSTLLSSTRLVPIFTVEYLEIFASAWASLIRLSFTKLHLAATRLDFSLVAQPL